MKKILHSVLFCLVLASTAFATQSAYYTIKVGTFLSPEINDFTSVRSMGYVYANHLEGDLYEVFMGRFNDAVAADEVVKQLKTKGYLDALIEERQVDEGKLVTVIQIATRAVTDQFNWEKFISTGQLHTILSGNNVKIVTGPYPDVKTAKQKLADIKRLGFQDAFIKNVNTIFLHRVSPFEMGGLKQPLIPLNLETEPVTTNKDQIKPTTIRPEITPVTTPNPAEEMASRGNSNTPSSFDKTDAGRITPKAVAITAAEVPAIRTNVKRRSVLNLQTILKVADTYTGSLDGLYGKGTAGAYLQAKKTNRQLQKYVVLAPYVDLTVTDNNESQTQKAINMLLEDAYNATQILNVAKEPIAKSYLAYWSFTNKGPSAEVNQLMNTSIQEAFRGQSKANAPFDFTATYAYNDLNQLILHLRYVQGATAQEPAAPCWLFLQHPQATAQAFSDGKYRMQNCGGFDDWEEVKILQAITSDLNADEKFNGNRLSQEAALRTQLFIAPTALNASATQELDLWNNNLWKSINTWAETDPLHEEIADVLKITYFQTQVLMEDHFMDKGFNVDEAKGLALQAMKSLVGYHLARFQ